MSFVLSACSPDNVAPQSASDTPEVLLSGSTLHDLGPICYEPLFVPIVDANGNDLDNLNNPYGELQISYNLQNTFLTLNLGPGWFVDKAAWYIGSAGNVPITQNGLMNPNGFPESDDPAQHMNSCTFTSGFVTQNVTCYESVFWAEILRISFFSGPIPGSNKIIFAGHDPLLNGYMYELCYSGCSLEPAN